MSTKRILIVLLALIAVFGLVAAAFQPATAAVQTPANCKRVHTVQEGEYLLQIAKKYESNWRYLVKINGLSGPLDIAPGQVLCLALSTTPITTAVVVPPASTSSGSIVATSVKEDENVTLRGKNLWGNTRYTVYMGNYSASAANKYVAGYVTTDKDGAFSATIRIPKKLVDVKKISVQVNNGQGDAAKNWFINATADGNTGGEGSPSFKFSVIGSDEDSWVKIKTENLPSNVLFEVRMGTKDSKGVDGVVVGTLVDPKGGSVKASFDIPAELRGRSKIDIRLENKSLGIYYYLTFINKDS